MKSTLNYLSALLVAGLLVTGCSDPVSDTDPDGNSTSSSLSALNEALETASPTPIDLGDAMGLIGIHTGPRPGETEPVLNVRLIVFNGATPATPPFKTGGLDIGTITVSHAGAAMTLNKVTLREGGVVYESMSKPERGTPPTGGLAFVAGNPVELTTSGADGFAAQTFTIETTSAPDITNLAAGTVIDGSQDLTLNWTGGTADSVHVILADVPPQPGMGMNGPGGKVRGGKGPGGKGPHGPGMGPKPVYRIAVDGTAGTVTIPAAELTTALAALKGTDFVISVNQRVISDVAAETGTLKAVLHTADGVRVTK